MPPQSSQPSTSAAVQPSGTSNGSGGLSPAGSPPLILAFLAIGIFSAAMIAVFGWRRVQYPREGGGSMLHDGGQRRLGTRAASVGASPSGSSRFGEKPALWDLWTDRNSKAHVVDYGTWDNIMPLAVVPASHGELSKDQNESRTSQGRQIELPSSLSPPPRTPVLVYSLLGPRGAAVALETTRAASSRPVVRSSSVSSRSRTRQGLGDLMPLALLRRHRRGVREVNVQANSEGIVDSQVNHTEGGEERDKGEVGKDGEKMIRVAVIIEMPSPVSLRRQQCGDPSVSLSSLSGSENDHKTQEEGIDSEPFQYCIGVHTCAFPAADVSVAAGKASSERMPSLDDEK